MMVPPPLPSAPPPLPHFPPGQAPPTSPPLPPSSPAISPLLWLGIGLVIAGQFIGSTGMLLMKRGAVREAAKPFYCRKNWMCGFALFLLNTVGLDSVIYATTPLDIVAPLTSLGLVFVSLGAAVGFLVPKEQLVLKGWLSIAVIVVGIVLASVYGPKTEASPTMHEMALLARQPAFLCTALPALGLALVCVLLLICGKLPPKSHLKVIWCAVSATTFGALSVICFKAISISLRNTFEGHNQFKYFGTYLMILATAVCAPANVILMNKTFEESSAMYGMPLYQALLILATVMLGGIFYDEFHQLVDDGTTVQFSFGVLISLSGVAGLAFYADAAEATEAFLDGVAVAPQLDGLRTGTELSDNGEEQ
jgi:hypothetical protein